MRAPLRSYTPAQLSFLRRMDRAFALLSVALLILFSISTFGECLPEWRRYQHAYASAVQRGDPLRTGKLPQGLQQVFNQELGVVDRCPTCHAGFADRTSVSSAEPLRAHPGQLLSSHPPERFGCSSCHQGQGRGTTVAGGHGHLASWPEPLRSGAGVQSSCAGCHSRSEAPHAPDLRAGFELIRRHSCNGCHLVPELPGQPGAPPDLTGLRGKSTREWVYRWLKDPVSYQPRPTRRMPDFGLSDLEIASLIELLFDEKQPLPRLEPARPSSPAGAQARAGQELFSASRCISCHAVQGKGGSLAPELGRVQAKVGRDFLLAWLKRPRSYSAQTIMPRFRFTDDEIGALADYLEEEFEDEDGEKWEARARQALAVSKPRASLAAGRKLAQTYNCAGCHSLPGLKAARIGPELTEFGSKDLHRIDFGAKPALPRTRQAWALEKLRDPRGFSKLLRMPRFELAAEERFAITTALLSFQPRRFPPAVTVASPETPWSAPRPPGEVGELFQELSCLECHSLDGRGGTMAPDLGFEGSQVKREWLLRYLKEPQVIRPSLVERMLPLRLRDQEVKLLVEYLMTARQRDGVPRNLFGAGGPAPDLVARGRRLFEEKYACGSCHITSHSKGYLGPELSRVGDRLQPGWIHLQLRQPGVRPRSIEPDLGVSDEDARALTAYLMGLTAPASAPAGPAGAAR